MLPIFELLRKKRLEKGFQQIDIARELKISPPAYSKIENGITKLTVELANKIAKILEIPLSDLLESNPKNYEIKNGNNSPLAVDNSTLIYQNEKLTQSVINISEKLIEMMNNQNQILKEFKKLL